MAGVLVVALLYMLGRYTPVYALAFEYVPGINLFRRPIDAPSCSSRSLAIVVGQLLADYVREGTRRPALATSPLSVWVRWALIGWAVLFSAKTHHGWASLVEVLKVAPMALLVIGCWCGARTPPCQGDGGGLRRDGGDG